jgi:hypothetical protein
VIRSQASERNRLARQGRALLSRRLSLRPRRVRGGAGFGAVEARRWCRGSGGGAGVEVDARLWGVSAIPQVRTRRQRVEAPVDEAMLRWIARFRFVSAVMLEKRFAVSARMCRERMGRLSRARLVVSHQQHLSAPQLYAIGPAGRTALGMEHRRAPRWDTQVVHELAIARLVGEIEVARPDIVVLTERDCRRREAVGTGSYSVRCVHDGKDVRRWPDIVVEAKRHRRAVELEMSPKTTRRLEAIFVGYLDTGTYDRVQVRCGSEALWLRARRVAERLGAAEVVKVVRG